MSTQCSSPLVANFIEDDNPLLEVPRQYLCKTTAPDSDSSTSAVSSFAEIVSQDMAQLKAEFDPGGFVCYELAYDTDDDSDISLLPV